MIVDEDEGAGRIHEVHEGRVPPAERLGPRGHRPAVLEDHGVPGARAGGLEGHRGSDAHGCLGGTGVARAQEEKQEPEPTSRSCPSSAPPTHDR
jgi:hypothetical protein